MSAEDLGLLKRLAEGEGELRIGKGLMRSLIAQAETLGATDPAERPVHRTDGSHQ